MITRGNEKYIILHINGSASLDIMGTAVVQAIKKKFPDRNIIVVSHNIGVWLHNPNVYRVYQIGQTPYFYENYIKDKDTIVFAQDPQKTTDYIFKKKHLIEIWCDLCKVPYNNELPKLFFTQREEEVTRKMIPIDRPIFFIQISNPEGSTWTKDLSPQIANQICEYYINKGYIPIQIMGNKNQAKLPRAMQLNLDFRKMLCALKFSQKRLFTDSFLQHAASALGLPSVVTWITGSPEISSYRIHEHIKITPDENLKKIIDEYSDIFDINMQNTTANINISGGFNAQEIVNKLESL